jgi:hypothetical protein
MKKIIYIIPLLVVITVFMTLSCDLLGMSISSRVSSFVTDLNKSYGNRNLRAHFHADMQFRSSYDEDSFEFTPLSWNYDNFDIALDSYEEDRGGGVIYRYGALTKTEGGISPDVIEFCFQEEGEGDWYIIAIRVQGEAETWGNMALMP